MGIYEDNRVLERLDRIEVAINTLLQLAQGPTAATPASQTISFRDSPEGGAADPTQDAAPNPNLPADQAETTQAPPATATQQDTAEAPIGTGNESAGNTETVGSAQVGATKPE
jgi:hypothetical protein